MTVLDQLAFGPYLLDPGEPPVVVVTVSDAEREVEKLIETANRMANLIEKVTGDLDNPIVVEWDNAVDRFHGLIP